MSNEQIETSKRLINLSQKPIIDYSEMEARGLEVAEKISLMNLDTIEATEENRGTMKKMRAELNKELSVFEDQRKMIHDAITRPYKSFTKSYDENIKSLYEKASSKLKEKIGVVEARMLEEKNAGVQSYFRSVCDFDFIDVDSVGLNVILSASNKKLYTQIDEFVAKVTGELNTIKSLENSIRVDSLYKTNLDLAGSISTANADVQRETELKERREREEEAAFEKARINTENKRIKEEREANERLLRKKAEADEIERKRVNAEKNAKKRESKAADDEFKRLEREQKEADDQVKYAEQECNTLEAEKEARVEQDKSDNAIHKMTFSVSGTIAQLKSIKTFLDELGVTYE